MTGVIVSLPKTIKPETMFSLEMRVVGDSPDISEKFRITLGGGFRFADTKRTYIDDHIDLKEGSKQTYMIFAPAGYDKLPTITIDYTNPVSRSAAIRLDVSPNNVPYRSYTAQTETRIEF